MHWQRAAKEIPTLDPRATMQQPCCKSAQAPLASSALSSSICTCKILRSNFFLSIIFRLGLEPFAAQSKQCCSSTAKTKSSIEKRPAFSSCLQLLLLQLHHKQLVLSHFKTTTMQLQCNCSRGISTPYQAYIEAKSS